MGRKLTQKEVLDRFKKVHGDEYDYSLVDYKGGHTNVKIICTKDGHGVFTQRPSKHFRGQGCPDCGIIKRVNSTRKNTEQFIEESKLVHEDEYNYSLVRYVDDSTKVKIICKKDGHGVFTQTPSNHLRGQGCPVCGRIKSNFTRTKSTGYFIKQSMASLSRNPVC